MCCGKGKEGIKNQKVKEKKNEVVHLPLCVVSGLFVLEVWCWQSARISLGAGFVSSAFYLLRLLTVALSWMQGSWGSSLTLPNVPGRVPELW